MIRGSGRPLKIRFSHYVDGKADRFIGGRFFNMDAPDIDMIYAWAEELAQYTKFNVFGGTITCSSISGSAFNGSLSGLLYSTPDGGISLDYANGTFNLNN